MATWLKDLGVTNYDFRGVFEYAQYRDIDAIVDFNSALNSYLAEGLQTFFGNFKDAINLKTTTSPYVNYYLINYYGMLFSLLDVGSYVLNFYDSGYIKYDSVDTAGDPYKYDDISLFADLSTDKDATNNLADYSNVTACVAQWSLDRSIEVLSIPAVWQLLENLSQVYYGESLDMSTIKMDASTKVLVITLPNRPLWQFLQRTARNTGEFFLNFPLDQSIDIQISSI